MSSPDPSQDTPITEPVKPVPATSDWRQDLGPDLKDHPIWEKYKSNGEYVKVPRDVPKALVEAQRFIGGEKIPAPREDWTEQDWSQHFARLGRPENVDGYEVSLPEGMPEGYPRNEDVEKAMLAAMYKAGVPKREAQQLYQDYYKLEGARWQQFQENAQALTQQYAQKLRQDWGQAYEANVDLSKKAYALVFPEGKGGPADTLTLADGTLLGNHPAFVQMFVELGKKLSGARMLGAQQGGPRSMLEPKEAEAEYAKLQAKLFSMDKEDPEREALVDRLNQLGKMAWQPPEAGA